MKRHSRWARQGGHLRLQVFDLAGRLVATLADGQEPAGWREVTWNGGNSRGLPVTLGVHLARLDSGGQTRVRKIVASR